MKKKYFFLIIFLPGFLFSQSIILDRSQSDGDFPEITWRTLEKIDTTDFKIFRKGLSENNFSEISTLHYVESYAENDTIKFYIVDTTLEKQGLFLYQIKASINGVAMVSESAYGHNFGLLPQPHLSNFKATPIENRKAIRLDWKLNYHQTVSSMTLYRSRQYDDGFDKVTELGSDMISFEDVVPMANEPWFYFMIIHDYFGNQLPSIRIPAFATFSEKPIRPLNIKGEKTDHGIQLSWKNTGKNIIGYRVYRSIEGKSFQLVNEMFQNIEEDVTFTDSKAQLKSALKVNYYVRNVSDGFIESNSSDTLFLYFPEHEKVLPPQEIDYISDNKGNIKLLWIPSDEGLVFGFNVYLTHPNGEVSMLNKDLITQNYYVDTIFRSSGKYKYEVESVGFNNLKSQNKISATINRYPIQIHVIVDLKKQKDGIQISWKRPLNKHVKKLKLYKKFGKDQSVLKKSFSNEEDVVYLDTKVNRGTTYFYSLIAVLENGVEIMVNDGVEISW